MKGFTKRWILTVKRLARISEVIFSHLLGWKKTGHRTHTWRFGLWAMFQFAVMAWCAKRSNGKCERNVIYFFIEQHYQYNIRNLRRNEWNILERKISLPSNCTTHVRWEWVSILSCVLIPTFTWEQISVTRSEQNIQLHVGRVAWLAHWNNQKGSAYVMCWVEEIF